MPIYEFYCPDCHAIYSFFSRRVNADARPPCPSCTCLVLERQVSLFSVSKNRSSQNSDGMVGIDEDRLESALMSMAGDLDKIDNDPSQVASAMRKLLATSGLKMGAGMEDAMARVEAGEDPEVIEADLGDATDEIALLSARPTQVAGVIRRRYLPPRVDPKLYEWIAPD